MLGQDYFGFLNIGTVPIPLLPSLIREQVNDSLIPSTRVGWYDDTAVYHSLNKYPQYPSVTHEIPA